MYRIIIVLLILSSLKSFSNPVLNLVPYPQKAEITGGRFKVETGFKINASDDFQEVKEYLKSHTENWENALNFNKKKKIFPVSLQIDSFIISGDEAYQLLINKSGIVIRATSKKGCFYGVQTLIQLAELQDGNLWLPEVKIYDYPQFAWRSYMLDESRYFFGKEFVLRLLDELAALKINKFHWHLTDDAGWRIEIKKYPKLTEIGAFRDSTQINFNGQKWDSNTYDGKPHGGFYTQEDIKEIVAYAAVRNIDIIPEIEMPGHSSAAIAAYPWLGIVGEPGKVPVRFGKMENSYNISNARVITFLHDVLDEVCDLFPAEVIHIGGDEVLFGAWKESEEMQAYMKKNNIKTPSDAQIRFTNDISKYLEANGKRMMGWNEILGKNVHGFENAVDYKSETVLSKKSVIHFWRGEIPLITEAAQNGYEIVNSLHTETYLNYTYEDLPLQRMYNFKPMPDGLATKYHKNIIGVGVQMWTEWTPTSRDVEYHTYPRIAAVAEVAWSGAGEYSNFIQRLKNYSKRWTQKGINFPIEEIK
ncbi:MAG: beta-N-acetylhexosaminidase [Bacteroidota bacterium]